MLELNYALNLIMKGLESELKELNFNVQYPDGVQPPELPIEKDGAKSIIMYRGEKGRVRIVHEGDKLALYCATVAESDAPDNDMPRASLNLLDLETFDERDLKYIFEEYIETLHKLFGTKEISATQKKLPTPVSKTQAKSGALAYDGNTLGNRFTSLYPELREEYKKNVGTYDEFLADDFFDNFGNAKVIEVLRSGNKVQIRKLFNLLNEIYEDGTNDTQSIVGVTILGTVLAENPDLFPIASEYFSETMAEPVTEVYNYLKKSKSARMRLKNPPIYKPKKKKSGGLMQQMMGMSTPQQ